MTCHWCWGSWAALDEALPKSSKGLVMTYNDTHTKKTIIRLFERAIARLS